MNEQLQNELEEQARLLGMSAERECDLRGKIERLERERDEARNAMAQAQCESDLKMLDLERIREQRDKYKSALDKYSEDELTNTLQSLKNQRDELLKLLELFPGFTDDARVGDLWAEQAAVLLAAWKEARSE